MRMLLDAIRILGRSALFLWVVSLLVSPLRAAVESDVVGYTTIKMEAGKWYIVGTPFVPLNNAPQTFKVNELFETSTFSNGDLLYLTDKDGTFTFYYWNSEYEGWSKSPRIWQEDNIEYPITTGLYLHPTSDASVTFSGTVAMTEIPVGTAEGNSWNLISLVCPISATLNAYSWSGFSSRDVLYTLNADGRYVPHYWHQSAEGTGWSTSARIWLEDQTPLEIGQAVYIFKVSPGIGSISMK